MGRIYITPGTVTNPSFRSRHKNVQMPDIFIFYTPNTFTTYCNGEIHRRQKDELFITRCKFFAERIVEKRFTRAEISKIKFPNSYCHARVWRT